MNFFSPNLRPNLRRDSATLISAIFLVVTPINFDFSATVTLPSFLELHLIPPSPGLPFAAPSKLILMHPSFGGFGLICSLLLF